TVRGGLGGASGWALYLRPGGGPAARLALPGVPLVAGGAAAIAWGLVGAGGSGWSDPWAIAAFVVGAVLLAGFVLRERRAAEPMLPPRLVSRRTLSGPHAPRVPLFAAVSPPAVLTPPSVP